MKKVMILVVCMIVVAAATMVVRWAYKFGLSCSALMIKKERGGECVVVVPEGSR